MSNILSVDDVAEIRTHYTSGHHHERPAYSFTIETLCNSIESLRAQVEERDRAIAALVEAMEYASEAFKPVVRLRYFPEGGEQVGNHIHCELALQRIKAAIAHAEALAGGGK